MQLQLNTDHHLRGSEALAARLGAEVESALARFAPRITRVEMHLNDLNGGDKSGPDKRCQLEARIAGRSPVSVTHVAINFPLAIDGALDKLSAALEHAIGKRMAAQRRAPHHGMGDALGADALAARPVPDLPIDRDGSADIAAGTDRHEDGSDADR